MGTMRTISLVAKLRYGLVASFLAAGLTAALPAAADTPSDYLDLSLGDIPLAESISPRRQDPLILNGLPSIRSTGSIDLIGIRPAEGLRLEADLSSHRGGGVLADFARSRGFGGLGESPNGRFGSVGTGISLIHDWDTEGPVRPYVLGGFGASHLVESRGLEGRAFTLTERLIFDFQFGAGLGVTLADDMTLAAGYRFISNIGEVTGYSALDRTTAGRATSSHLFGVTVRMPLGEPE